LKILLTCDYPFVSSGLSILAESCYNELTKLGHSITPHSLFDHSGIERLLQTEKFDVHLGVGHAGNSVEQISLPKKYGLPTCVWYVSETCITRFKDILPKADSLLVTSNYSKKMFLEQSPECKPSILYIGTDTDFFKPKPEKPSKLFSTFVSSGEVKGCEEVLSSISILSPKNLNFKYVVHSPHIEYKLEKDYMQRLRSVVQNNHLEKWVSLVGGLNIPKEKMPSLYQTMYFYMCSMRLGSFGIPIIEAGACGVPTIAGNWEPMSEIIKDGETGLLVPYMAQAQEPKFIEGTWYSERYKMIDIQLLAEKLSDLLQDEDKRNKLGQAARKDVMERFNIKTQIKSLEQELLGIV
jgi:glycosyltransferase involved in cell wall biosynthesis